MFSSAHSSAVYLDHAATTPMYPAVIEAMAEVFATVGNASSLHGSGRSARRRIEESRESVAACLGARPSEVIFTSGGTESDNLAVKGIFWGRRDADPRRTRILASAVEHHAVLDAVEWLVAHEGAQVTWLPVDASGAVTPDVVRAALAMHSEETALVTVMWANNETGTVNPIGDIAAIASAYDVPVHSDAVQAAAQLPIDFAASGLSALSITGHKLGGPQGVGALLLGRQVSCVPLSHGGGHERDLRSGTQDTASIVGLASALRITTSEMPKRSGELIALRDSLIDGVQRIAPDAVLNGPTGTGRLPGSAHFTFAGCEGDSLLMLLDVAGVECSTGSACTAGVASASHVLTAMGVDPVVARGSLRFSLGHTSTDRDVETLLSVLPQVIERARAAGLASAGAPGTHGGNR
ncbi:cysteine desulfurase family protein [Rhodococcus xishaensis]|uniref:Cysteine desulfurase n=1 Tax=Rhodococcus xishaensis TaxID=2487364 RepID=A0A3S3E439_9NOCA|nr:cysteine desulfurase family protein [Rhodococcus xishaensis]RVW05381.1 cysteine desulfurase [Rhodococcus xishaensis]